MESARDLMSSRNIEGPNKANEWRRDWNVIGNEVENQSENLSIETKQVESVKFKANKWNI